MPTSQLMPLIGATQQHPPLSVDVTFRDRPCDISTGNDIFQIALSIEIVSNNIARVKQLLCHSHVGITSSKKSPLAIALEYQRHDILRQLLDDFQVDANAKDSKGHTPLHLAVIYDDPVAVRILLEYPRVDVNCLTAAGDSALLLAAKKFDGNSTRISSTEWDVRHSGMQQTQATFGS
ncbi:hypothetical protein N7540_011127 [Penicillium herquei]|nr:hypothetical protein N7540_011127 [Penicillium herquei]